MPAPLRRFHIPIHLHQHHSLTPNGRSYCIHKSYRFISTPAKVIYCFLSGNLIDQHSLNELREILTNLHSVWIVMLLTRFLTPNLAHFPNTWYGFKKPISSPFYPGFFRILNAVTTASVIVLILKQATATMAERNRTSQAEPAPSCTLTLNLWGGSTVGGKEQAL